MAKTDTTRIEALEAILAEKRKHEGYLAKLEERRPSGGVSAPSGGGSGGTSGGVSAP